MPIVSEVIAHILKHTNAVASDSDTPQHTAGKAERALYVTNTTAVAINDDRDLTMDQIMAALSSIAVVGAEQASYQAAIANEATSTRPRPQLALADWVGTGSEVREI